MQLSTAASARLAAAARNGWAASILQATFRQPRWVSIDRGIEDEAERAEAARLWRAFADHVREGDQEGAALCAQSVVLRVIHTVLPKLYREAGLSEAEIALRLRVYPSRSAS